MTLKPGLYIVSTPIGNLEDITLRALNVLACSDVIFCEDTRVSSKLLTTYNIKVSLKIYNDNSDKIQRTYIQNLILEGKIISLISDAGTPLISDPGYKLVRFLKKTGINVDVVPGPCALIAALSISGLATNQFIFAGFLPKTKEKKIKIFKEFMFINATIIFYDTANRLLESLDIAYNVLGNRSASVSRELTKIYHKSQYSTLCGLKNFFSKNLIKGEVVLCIAGAGDSIKNVTEDILINELQNLLSNGKSARSASDDVLSKYKSQYSRKKIYQLVNNLKL